MDIDEIGCYGLIHTECQTPSSLLMGSNTALRGTFPTSVESLLEDLQIYHLRARDEYMGSRCSLKDIHYPQGTCDSAILKSDDVECPVLINVEREPLRLLRRPFPAPPPKLHFSTWWRSLSRRLMDQQ
jgi:hypothetical protein